MKFELNEKEISVANEFKDICEKFNCCKEEPKESLSFSYEFLTTSVGRTVVVKCLELKASCNVTDYNSW